MSNKEQLFNRTFQDDTVALVLDNFINGNLSRVKSEFEMLSPAEAACVAVRVFKDLSTDQRGFFLRLLDSAAGR